MKEVLIVSIGFSPNIGGIETHFDDLVSALDKRGWKVWVLTYKPITTKVSAKTLEHKGKNIFIYRIPWIGNIFYKLVNKPIFEFLYLLPGLFIFLPPFLIFKGKNTKVIHSHGLIAGAASVFWGKIFGKRVITTTHSIYSFPKNGTYTAFARWIFKNSDFVLGLSQQAVSEIRSLGIPKSKSGVFTYWVDLDKFKRIPDAKEKVSWQGKFVVLFVGRLVPEKGINELLVSFKSWDKKISLAIAGTGSLEDKVKEAEKKFDNLIYLGKIVNEKLPVYYSAADVLIVPSVHEEGFGRVVLESLACGTPVIGSNRGAIPEAMNNTVGRLIKITPENLKNTVGYFYKNPDKLDKLSKNCRRFALERYSEKNVETIVKTYRD